MYVCLYAICFDTQGYTVKYQQGLWLQFYQVGKESDPQANYSPQACSLVYEMGMAKDCSEME